MKAHTLCLVPCLLLLALFPLESVDQNKSRAWAGAGDQLTPRLFLLVDPPITNKNGTLDDAELFTQDSVDHRRTETDDQSLALLPATAHDSIKTIRRGDQARAKSQPEIQTTARKNLGMLCKPAELDTHRITNSAHNTGTHCDLTAANYTLSAQREDAADARNADARNAGAIGIKVHKRAAHWPRISAFYAYGLIAAVIAWACSRIYSSYVWQRKSDDLANRLYECESEADDDLHELMETQGELAASAKAHSEVTLSLMWHCISFADQRGTKRVRPAIGRR